MSHKIDIIRAAEWLTLAGVGGAARFIGERMKRSNETFKGTDFLILLGSGFISGFSGFLGALLISTITHDHVYHLIASGVFGYFGTQGIERIGTYVLNRFKV